jgi:ubiquinone biosynthesis protein
MINPLMNSALVGSLVSSLPPAELQALSGAFLHGGSREERIAAIEAALGAPGAKAWRAGIGKWITAIIPVDTLVDAPYAKWRPLVEDSFQFLFSHLSDRRLAWKILEQVELSADTPAETRLLKLISGMPGLQKLGQVLARNRRLSPALRQALEELENGMCDATPIEIRAIVREQLGERLEQHAVELDAAIFKEGSASAILRFTWLAPGGDREGGVFKVLKPYVPACFSEDMTLLQQLGRFLASADRGYQFAVSDVRDMLVEVRLLLEHELDFEREQKTLVEARRLYRSSFGIRVPHLIPALSTPRITAMSEESSLKVTDAFARSPIRRSRIPGQLIEALIAVPLFCRDDVAVFHADPHAGNLMYDETNRELVVLDWALAERLSRDARRHLVLLVAMTILQNPAGVREAIAALSRHSPGPRRDRERLIALHVGRFFSRSPHGRPLGTLDAMLLLDEIALAGVHFPTSLFFFRKSVFTLDGVLQDVAGADVRIDAVILREFLTRCLASFGLFHAPLELKDFAAMEWQAVRRPFRSWKLPAEIFAGSPGK